MRCMTCQGDIPDGSRFCGLCGAKQERPAHAETLVAGGGRAQRSATRTLISGPGPREEIVSSGGHRFAALSVGPSPLAPEPEVTDTLAEGVPAGALAGLLAARRAHPASPLATLVHATPLTRTSPVATQQDLPSAPPGVIDSTARDHPALAPATDAADATDPDRPAEAAAPGVPPAELAAARVSVVLADRSHLDPSRANMPSVIVDSQFSRDAAEAADLGHGEPPANAASDAPFRETAWFIDALDSASLERAEDEDPRERQARLAEADAQALDARTRQRFSLRTQDALPAASASPTVDAVAPTTHSNRAAVAGLIAVIVIALGVAGWFLFGG